MATGSTAEVVVALVSESRRVSLEDLAAFAPACEAYAALVRARWGSQAGCLCHARVAVRAYPRDALTGRLPAPRAEVEPVPPGAIVARVKDRLEVPGALGYHDVGAGGVPRIFASLRGGWRVTLTHELAEAMVNPGGFLVDEIEFGGGKLLVRREVCDPVNRRRFRLGGFWVADFVFPGWFGLPDRGGGYNQRGTIRRPGGLDGGYVTLADGTVRR